MAWWSQSPGKKCGGVRQVQQQLQRQQDRGSSAQHLPTTAAAAQPRLPERSSRQQQEAWGRAVLAVGCERGAMLHGEGREVQR